MGLSWSKRRDEQHEPNKAFSKARKVYGQMMTDAPVNPKRQSQITTDFDELLRIRKSNARRKFVTNRIFMFSLTAVVIIFFLWLYWTFNGYAFPF